MTAPTPVTSAQCSRSVSGPGCRPTSAMRSSSLPLPRRKVRSWRGVYERSPVRHPRAGRWRLRGPAAIIRHRSWTRGVAAQHASLSRWRSPVRIRSGPPSTSVSSHAPSARPDGAFFFPPDARTAGDARACRLSRVSVRDPGFDPRQPSSRSMAHPSDAAPGPRPAPLARPGDRRGRRPRGARGRRRAGRRRAVGRPAAPSGGVAGVGSPSPGGQRRRRPSPVATASPRVARARRVRPRRRRRPRRRPMPSVAIAPGRPVPVPAERDEDGGRDRASRSGDSPFGALVLVERDADGILDALGLDRGRPGQAAGHRPVRGAARREPREPSRPDRVPARGRGRPVGPRGRAGAPSRCSGRTGSEALADWPLVATLQAPAEGAPTYDPRRRVDDVRGRRHPARPRRLARDRGHTAPTSRSTAAPPRSPGGCKDCSPLGWDTPYTRRDRQRGRGARPDLRARTSPSPTSRTRRPTGSRSTRAGTTFSANPAYIEGLADAGLDWVSLANNHIGDAGPDAGSCRR